MNKNNLKNHLKFIKTDYLSF